MIVKYIAMFFVYSFLGWIMEVLITLKDDKKFVNRGFLIGPVIPIYGFGALLITILLERFSNNIILLFFMGMIVCSLLEYITSYVMEKLFKTRWWDYSKRMFNLNGRICLRNSIAFGVFSILIIYYSNPVIMNLLDIINPILLKITITIITIIFILDVFISTKIVFSIKGVGLSLLKDSTEQINDKVKEIILGKGLFTRRVIKAFPDFRVSEKFYKKIERNRKDGKESKTNRKNI